ncbi:ABC transporter ATP-binding protein [Paenibacillus mucilaginosus]|uniref:ABC transporter related protein n=1 Tax=Paenibacillus mucilaginosus (strain KNP414) TaxID=1036673 RepID=F8FRF0_PAEMK|nr:ABC transporter ATP-binding protein [Paenibacillus mucilaginosus]AEI40507.1 ABC transporter related protein [Paenibacillus mucilaginosus KNP414]MCG7218164.1 ATP-binding cassette domain-containing protein [Paenibacillus mucilaginosus]WDM29680.1 ATP-binding cassette domain-containing protein [Paenibacillus mucilaginosus]
MAVAILEIQDVSFRYPDGEQAVLDGVCLTVEAGEFVLLCGPAGCGKTSLLRHIKRELAPVGVRSGDILFDGRPLSSYDDRVLSGNIGMVQQSPENQTVTDRVLSELVFPMENVGLESALMRRRAAELSHYFGLDGLLGRYVHELSGGQKQLLQLASVLALQPRLLLLDEPTAQLDPLAARELIQLLQRINHDLGLTILVAEHRYEELLPVVDRVIAMDSGSIRHNGTPREAAQAFWSDRAGGWRDFVPPIPAWFLQDNRQPDDCLPLTVKEGRQRLQRGRSSGSASRPAVGKPPETAKKEMGSVLLECRELYWQYGPKDPAPVLKNASLQVREGEVLAILGANGSGKTTLLKAMAGILKPQKGKVLLQGKDLGKWKASERAARVGYLDQNPLTFFIEETVEAELQAAAARAADGEGLEAKAVHIEALVKRLGLSHVLARHPYDLSGGERQLAALAAVLLAGPDLLLLDEPTKGLDPAARRRWGERLRELQETGKTVVMVTHDVEFAADHATRCAIMFDGMLAGDGPPPLFFSDNLYYTTALSQLLRWN